MKRDGSNISLWQSAIPDFKEKQTAFSDRKFDVVVVGGGITGLSTALKILESGKSCLLAEAQEIGFGTSGGTTAHLNNFFDTPYYQVEKDFGAASAQLLAKGANDAISLIVENIRKYSIDCSFSKREGFLFALDEKQKDELEKIVESAKKVGVPMDFTNTSPFPVPYISIASVENQAQFNPAAYMQGLASVFENAGGVILQHCRVTEISGDEELEVKTSRGIVKASAAVYATHIPPGVNILHFRCAPYRSYALGLKLKGEYPEALGYDLHDPYRYYRTQEVDGQKYLIAGGEDHKTGHEENTNACFAHLESYVRKFFDVEEVAFKWSSQYFEPADGVAYIGHLPGNPENVFVATGFGGNGMIYGSLSALVLADLIRGKKTEYAKLFDPSRIKPVAGFSNFVKEAADVVGHFIGDKAKIEKIDSFSDLATGEARVVRHDGHVLALYKDEQQRLHAVNSACTHIKCTVAWNASEKSWDCPCHGSRFSYDGTMLTGPARKDLEVIKLA
ncbi:MAG: FAD-dependent oxidoreductase [Gemmatimonadaceae bacterium]|nr:FAD-dependent oxidoreductase [Chitinophagaceae bacterium]